MSNASGNANQQAVIAFFVLAPLIATAIWWIAGIEIVLVAVLALEIIRYADIQLR